MGTSGPRIFQDDFALDVREEFLALLLSGRSAEQATKDLVGEGHLDVDEEPVFWLSLAATQWEYGQLVPRVKKEEALRVIDTGVDLARWKPTEAKRALELGRLRAQLQRTPPKPKKVVSRRPKLKPGDVFRFPLGVAYGFGRVLTGTERAFYKFKSTKKDVPLAEIAAKDVAFVQGCTDDGFYKRRWRVLGNIPLEPKLTKPTWLFHQAVGEATCTVFDIWNRGESKTVPETACEELEQWGAWSEVHIVQRLEMVLAGRRWVDEGRANARRLRDPS